MANAKTVLEFAKKNGVKLLDLRFTDLPGLWQHVSYPIGQLTEDSFEEGFGMDGSSIRGWAAINESDMLLIPDPDTYMLDSFTEVPTLVMVCDVIDPVTHSATTAIRAISLRRPSCISRLPALPIPLTSAPKPSSSFSITSASISVSSTGSTSLMPKRDAGTQVARTTISDIVRATKRATSQFHRWTTIKTCAAKWS